MKLLGILQQFLGPGDGAVDALFARRELSGRPGCTRILRRSIDIESGMVKDDLIAAAAATKARPMPVLPEVGSISV